MRRAFTFIIATIGFALAAAQAGSAADLPIKGLAPPPVIAPSWTGFYVGGNGGAGWGTSETTVDVGSFVGQFAALNPGVGPIPPITLSVPLVSHDYNGFLGGIQVGYNWQTGIFVLGIEGDFEGTSMQDNAPCVIVLNCSVRHNWVADVTGRVGVAAFDKTLIYVKGGAAWTDAHYNIGNSIAIGAPVNVAVSANASSSTTLTGGLLGFGVEYPFLPNWSAKIEYDHIEFGRQALGLPITTIGIPGGIALPSIPLSVKDLMNMFKVGVNWRFW